MSCVTLPDADTDLFTRPQTARWATLSLTTLDRRVKDGTFPPPSRSVPASSAGAALISSAGSIRSPSNRRWLMSQLDRALACLAAEQAEFLRQHPCCRRAANRSAS